MSPGYMNVSEVIKVKPFCTQGAAPMQTNIRALSLQLFSRTPSGCHQSTFSLKEKTIPSIESSVKLTLLIAFPSQDSLGVPLSTGPVKVNTGS